MQGALRKTLAESHIAAITVAALLWMFVEIVYWAIWGLITAAVDGWHSVQLRGQVDYSASAIHSALRQHIWLTLLTSTVSQVISAVAAVAGAWLLSYWVYGTDPVHCLAAYSGKLSRRSTCPSD